jgi:hypothetical protein
LALGMHATTWRLASNPRSYLSPLLQAPIASIEYSVATAAPGVPSLTHTAVLPAPGSTVVTILTSEAFTGSVTVRVDQSKRSA